MVTVTVSLEELNEKLERMEQNMVAEVKVVQDQLHKQENNNRQLEADSKEMKKSLKEIKERLEKATQQPLREVQAEKEHIKKGEADETNGGPKVVIAGGRGENDAWLNSVEMFSLSKGSWTNLQPMIEARQAASSVVYDNQIILLGGEIYFEGFKSMEALQLSTDQPTTIWQHFPVEFPTELEGHGSVVYKDSLMVSGGHNGEDTQDNVTEISLVPPYTSKLLTTMPQKRWYHGTALLDDKLIIAGGRKTNKYDTTLDSVLMYDITKKKWKELAPLPHAMSEMATVKWGDNNIVFVGGVDIDQKELSKVVIYNIKTQKSHMLPEMLRPRRSCVGVVVKGSVIVMGGMNEEEEYVNTVESFAFDRFSWEELPPMNAARYRPTAVVV